MRSANASKLATVVGLGFLSVLSSSAAFAATVKSVNKGKGLVTIQDITEEDAIDVDATVCFYNDNDKSVGCGKVTKVKKTAAQVKLKSKKSVAKISEGMAARLKGSGGKTAKNGKGAEDGAAGGKAYKGKKAPMRVWASYSPALSTPATYNKLAYASPETTTPETVWDPNEAAKTSFLAFNFQLGIPVGSFSVMPGFRFRSYTDAQVDADYSGTDKTLFVRTQETATAIGFWTDLQFFRMLFTQSLALGLNSGLDVDMSSVKFKATKMDDDGSDSDAEIASATSSLTVMSLRLGADLDFMFVKSFGAHFGTTVMVPLAEFGKKFSGKVDDPNAASLEDPSKDLETQLGHKKNSVAYEVSIGLVLAF